MSKLQTAAEPTMEDILASIRKMISEERLGPRPIPDQIARTSYGSGSIGSAPVSAEKAEPRQPEPAAPAPEPGPAVGPERGTPSFSSLSNALKAATPSAEHRRSLDDKIADMLEKKGTATAAPVDPLAVFAATRPSPAPTTQPQARAPDAGPIPNTPRPDAPRTPAARPDVGLPGGVMRNGPAPGAGAPLQPANRMQGGLNGSSSGPKPADPGTVVPMTGETPAGDRDAGQPRPAAVAKSSDSERVIAMPTRQAPSVSGAGNAGASAGVGPATNGSPLNGTNVSPIGARPVNGSLNGPLNGSFNNGPLNGMPPRPMSPLSDADRVSDEIADEVLGRVADRLSPKKPVAPTADDKTVKADAAGSASPTLDTPSAKAPGSTGLSDPEATAVPTFAKAPEHGEAANADTASKASHTPSEALIDAVVDLVHREPDSLSVFTSGSAFIHGVGEDEDEASAGAAQAAGGGAPLDRGAAELLRPMLRQWLSENMPRIVEEALRSELMSSQASAAPPSPAATPKSSPAEPKAPDTDTEKG
jgi:cell pole-organizing protein PopZ